MVTEHTNAIIGSLSRNQKETLGKIRIFFGHQSVGGNVIEGIRQLDMDKEIDLDFSAEYTWDDPEHTNANLVHSFVGGNMDPYSKIDGFKEQVEEEHGNRADFAFFKMCYVDFDRETDVDRLFAYYKKSLDELKEKYPQTTFIHSTVPLVAKDVGLKVHIKNLIKYIIRRPVSRYQENDIREAFSDLIRSEYGGKEPIFDIAEWECTRPDGSREEFVLDGVSIPALYEGYASDEGHLNGPGSRYIAARFLVMIAESL